MPEWILLAFFAYLALLSLVFRDRPHLRGQPWMVLFAVTALFSALSLLERGGAKRTVEIVRDWLPVVLTFIAFREMEFFLPRDYDFAYEFAWIHWDRILLHEWKLRAAIESFGEALVLCRILLSARVWSGCVWRELLPVGPGGRSIGSGSCTYWEHWGRTRCFLTSPRDAALHISGYGAAACFHLD